MNKKAMELTINFVVMLILAIVVFGFGIKLTYDLFNLGSTTNEMLTKDMEAQLENMMNAGQRVAISYNLKQAYPGDSVLFGLGILNVGSADSGFKVAVDQGTAVDINEKKIWSRPELSYFHSYDRTIQLNQNTKIPVTVKVPRGTPRGTYSFKVAVQKCSSVLSCADYGQAQMIYVKVI